MWIDFERHIVPLNVFLAGAIGTLIVTWLMPFLTILTIPACLILVAGFATEQIRIFRHDPYNEEE